MFPESVGGGRFELGFSSKSAWFSVPGLLTCCSLVRFSRATPGLVSFGSLIRVSPVIYLRASRSQGLRRRKFSGAQQLLFPMLVAQLRPSEERFSQKTEALAVPT